MDKLLHILNFQLCYGKKNQTFSFFSLESVTLTLTYYNDYILFVFLLNVGGLSRKIKTVFNNYDKFF